MVELGNMSLHTTTPGGNGTEKDNGSVFPLRTNLILLNLDLVICLLGLVGNGIVIWFLSCKIKRNVCTIYILNLAVADFTFGTGSSVNLVHFLCTLCEVKISEANSNNLQMVTRLMYDFGFNTSCFVLMAISVERCMCVLFPIWYQSYRQKHQSVIVCLLLWMLSCLVTGLEYFICHKVKHYQNPVKERCTPVYLFTSVLFMLLTLLMVLSSLTLLIKIRKTSKQCHPLRLYIVIMGTVLVFLLSVLPARLLRQMMYFNILHSDALLVYVFYVQVTCNSIHCSNNPYMYILVGRWGKRGCKGSIKQALEKVFSEEKETS